MKPSNTSANLSHAEIQPADDFEPTGVPGLKTWRGVYVFVMACFIFSVILLVVLTIAYR